MKKDPGEVAQVPVGVDEGQSEVAGAGDGAVAETGAMKEEVGVGV